MPNHIKNRLTITASPEKIQEILEKFGTNIPAEISRTYDGELYICKNTKTEGFSVGWLNPKTGEFTRRDEPKVMGLPDGWEIEINQSRYIFPDFEKVIPAPDHPAYRDEPNQKEAQKSPYWWHTWNSENWGTKWSAYECEKEAYNVYTFETAWAGVPNIIREISKQFPDIVFSYEYADEDTGYNVGRMKYKSGGVAEDYFPEGGTKEAFEIAFSLRPDLRQYYELVEGEYIYKDEE